MSVEISYRDWLNLSHPQRLETHQSWRVYRGEGEAIVQEAADRLQSTDSRIHQTRFGPYHGGEWVIYAVVDNHEIEDCRGIFDYGKYFQGFRVFFETNQGFLPSPENITWPDPDWSRGHYRPENL